MPVDGKKKNLEERVYASEQAGFGWHTVDASADTYGEGNGKPPPDFKYSGMRAVGGQAVVEFVNEKGVDDDSTDFLTGGDGSLTEDTFDQGVYEPGLFSSVTVTTGVVRLYIAYESPEVE